MKHRCGGDASHLETREGAVVITLGCRRRGKLVAGAADGRLFSLLSARAVRDAFLPYTASVWVSSVVYDGREDAPPLIRVRVVE